MGCGQSSQPEQKGPPKAAPATGERDKDRDKKEAKKENADFSKAVVFLAKVPLFKLLPKDEHPLLAAATTHVEFKKGEVIIRQGDPGKEFFVIQQGECSVTVSTDGGPPNKVATLKAGDYFGENALLRDEPRSATITADTQLVTFKITRDKFAELGLNEKLQFANRKAVGAGAKMAATKPPSAKTDKEKELMAKALKDNENLCTMVHLDDMRVKAMIEVAWTEDVPAGTEIITEGDLEADYFYIVREGSFEITISEHPEQRSAETAVVGGEQKVVSTVGKGGCFGELALLYLVPRAATVKATEASAVWVIDRQNFKNILMKVSEQKIAEYVTYLSRVEILNNLLSEEKSAVARALVEMHFTKGEAVLIQGEPGSTFYILYDGTVAVTKDGEKVSELSASTKEKTAQFFGEKALLEGDVRAATVTVTSEIAKGLALTRTDFEVLLGPLKELMKQNRDPTARGSRLKNLGAKYASQEPKRKVLRKDLVRVGLLGCGGFGVVELFQEKPSGDVYAMKTLSKGYVVKTGMQESVISEKNILLMTNSPFVIKLYATYNGSQSLYFLLEVALGGELYATYNRKGFHGREGHAKFYIAGTVFAFEHLHERHIIYRDLKPENLLLNEKGQTKLTDMGLAKFVVGKTYTTCGTPDYFAPELIASTGHTVALDWWCLGILLFELMSGHPPFESAYPMQIYGKVMKGISKVPFPPKCQGPVGELIKGLLKKEPSERIPVRPGGTQNLKTHQWYSGFDWDGVFNLTIVPPYQPMVRTKSDIANFSARREDMPKQIDYKDDGSKWDADFATDE
eukprot:CAMPEP_0170596858 /NCGR_PEP_ID=MMETSP0224-20130122/15366_1 /TAXON_ID=285029 /ORGANISM="Togula jolla, Strain CCCM 725" /LENGTH=799 /DNA_ID=CAMNT_0010921227 /DNA_START=71 /DNA_END=2470 /DNA_ORIENTATION=+